MVIAVETGKCWIWLTVPSIVISKMFDLLQKSVHKVAVIIFLAVIYGLFLFRFGVGMIDREAYDFPSFYFASTAVFQHHSTPYDHSLLVESNSDFDQRIFPFVYPPVALLYLYPLSLTTYDQAKDLFFIFNHCLVLLVIGLIFSVYRIPFSSVRGLVVVLMILLFYPLALTISHGQVNLIILCFLLAFWKLKDQEFPWQLLAGLFLASAICLKVYPGLFLLYLLLTKQIRVFGFTLAWLGLLFLISLVAFPINNWVIWFTEVLPTGGYGKTPLNLFSPAAPWNQSINGFMSRMFLPNEFFQVPFANPVLGRILTYAVSIVLLGLSLGRIIRNYAAEKQNPYLGLVLILIFLLAPLSWEHHLVFVLPVLVLLFLRAVDRESVLLLGLTAVCYLILGFRIMGLIAMDQHIFWVSLKLYIVLLLWWILFRSVKVPGSWMNQS